MPRNIMPPQMTDKQSKQALYATQHNTENTAQQMKRNQNEQRLAERAIQNDF